MGLPEEDRPPSWLSDYGDIAVDVSKLAEFAAQLEAEVTENYVPHLRLLYDDMTAELPGVRQDFAELFAFLTDHRASQEATTHAVHFYPNATGRLVAAAREISNHYRNADAFSVARLEVVQRALAPSGTAPPAAASPPAETNDPAVY